MTSVVALVLASRALKEIDAAPGRYTNRSTITTARVIAWVVIGLVVVYLFYFIYTGAWQVSHVYPGICCFTHQVTRAQ